jgi:hypothetical protein
MKISGVGGHHDDQSHQDHAGERESDSGHDVEVRYCGRRSGVVRRLGFGDGPGVRGER